MRDIWGGESFKQSTAANLTVFLSKRNMGFTAAIR